MISLKKNNSNLRLFGCDFKKNSAKRVIWKSFKLNWNILLIIKFGGLLNANTNNFDISLEENIFDANYAEKVITAAVISITSKDLRKQLKM